MIEFEHIYKENYPIVYKYILSLCRNNHLAEEITQEAFVRALEHMKQFDGKCQLYVWICQIAKNTYFTYLKKQKRFVSEDQIPIAIAPGPEEEFYDNEITKQLYALIDQLSEPYREVFSLRIFGELSFSQIGAIFGKTDSWARLIYYRAKKRIKEDLDE